MNYHIDTLPYSIAKKHPNTFDENGVLLSKIPYTQQYHYHTTAIASYAIVNEDNETAFQQQIQWLTNNINKDGSYQHDFSFPFYDTFPKPWVGGLCQGLAISALIRAYKKYNEELYLETAISAFHCLQRDITENGCCYTDDDGYIWIEEYPVKPKILNGFIYALFGVYDLYNVTEDTQVKTLFHSSINTLQTYLHEYDLTYWSRYDLINKFPATLFYHTVHVKQLHALFEITGNDFFETYHLKWKQASEKSMNHVRVQWNRLMVILKKRGMINSAQRYLQRRRWKKNG